ncbi:ankyrin repeat domain-containing protein 53 isoform X2 [Eleutherodactylus coqui]|uniref:ankyrin repeat domain-containing protein 53 isoform X2 n=1 Tax=Eleutherodactylus coqui TaxID=57060 RepID=UPI0034631F1A
MDVARDQLLAAATGNVDWLRLCMKAADSQMKADSYGFTALHMAAVHSRLPCLKLLLEDCSVDVNVPSAYGWRALHLVMNQKSGHRVMPCLRYLLRRGADVNVRSAQLSTPLHRAASEGLEDCIALLVAAGADVHAEDSEGHKPIDLCYLWCRRLSARYLRSAMWKKDKEDAVKELKKMEKIRGDIEELEDALIKMQIPFGESRGTKKLTEKLNRVNLEMETLPKSKPAPRYTDSSNRQRGKSGPSKKMKKKTTGRESTQKVRNTQKRVEQVSDGRKSASEKPFWNSSTNPQRPPTSYPTRPPTLWQGIYPDEVTRKDISAKVLLTKDKQGQLQIQTSQGQVFSAPNLPYEVIERSLFPKRGPRDRIQGHKDFKANHVFDVPRKQQLAESEKPSAEISFHLRHNLDSKFRKLDGESAA